ncbi:MAG TPA: TraX family protein [Sedimentibacter sp.]|nr:TraX family protein [Sedimentibacter sp.]
MSGLVLKIIALITMIIDHYGAIFQSNVILYRIIGRLAFPIYFFLLVEGYFHTSDVKKYGTRLLLFAFISEIPFDLAFFGKVGFEHQNIFFTLFIGLTTIYLIDKKAESMNKALIIFLAAALATLLKTDYQFIGIIYILAFYYIKNMPKQRKFPLLALTMLAINSTAVIQQFSLLALVPISFYNDKQGWKNKILQISFYIAYPLHLLLFYFVKNFS